MCLLVNYVAYWYVLIKLANQTWIKFDAIASLTIFLLGWVNVLRGMTHTHRNDPNGIIWNDRMMIIKGKYINDDPWEFHSKEIVSNDQCL